MSKVQVDKVVNLSDDGAPQLTYGAELPVGYGLTGAGGLNISGVVTAASAVFSGNVTIGGTLTYEDVTNIDVVGVSTFAGRMNVNSTINANEGIKVIGVSTLAAVTGTTGTFSGAVSGTTGTFSSDVKSTAGIVDIRSGSSINTNVTGGSASGTLQKNTTSGEFAIVSGGTGGNNYLSFYTSASAAPTEKLRITHAGDINIYGTAAGVSSCTWDAYANSFIFKDGSRAKFGDGSDLHVYHNGSNSVIREEGTGNLNIQTTGGNVDILVNTTETAAKFISDGAVELYYDDVKTFETSTGGATIQAAEGGSAYLYMSSDEGDDNGDKWQLKIDNGDQAFMIKNYASGSWETSIECNGNGNVEMYYDNTKTFETTSGGVEVFGVLQMDDGNSHIKLIDGARLDIGSSADLQIYHSGGENFIRGNASTSPLYIDCCNELQIRHLDTNGSNSEKMIVCNDDGAVELYHDNTKRIETLTDGAQIKGVSHIQSEDANSTLTEKAFYYAVGTNSSVTVTLTGLIGTGSFTAGGYANAGQGAIALHILFGGAMFGTQHYNVDVLQEGAMQNTSISKTKNTTSYVVTISNTSSSYSLNLHFGLKSQGAEMGCAFS